MPADGDAVQLAVASSAGWVAVWAAEGPGEAAWRLAYRGAVAAGRGGARAVGGLRAPCVEYSADGDYMALADGGWWVMNNGNRAACDL